MKGTIALVVLALGATWAFLFLPLTKPSAPRDKPLARAHEATPAPAQGPVPVPARKASAVPAPSEPSAAPTAPAKPSTAVTLGSSPTPSGQGGVTVIGASEPKPTASAPSPPRSPTQLAEPLGEHIEFRKPTGELGEGILSPDYRLLEESYVKEARDGPWAVQQELRIRNLLLAGDLGPRILMINCQSSVCRVHIEPHGQDPYGELLAVPGLAAALGIDSSTPYSLNSAELVVYAKPEPIPVPEK